MEQSNTSQREKTGNTLIVVGMIIMVLLSLTQLVPTLRIAGYSVLVGIGFFFVVEAVTKTPDAHSGLSFKRFLTDIKKPGVLLWALLPVVTAVVPFLFDELVLHMDFSENVLGRTDGMLSFENLPTLVFQVLILALGEEIAWRGFFVGKSAQKLPFWLCAVVSSLLFACGHIADGQTLLVLYDIGFVFIDSMIFSVIYRKSGNCLVSAVSHIIGNAIGLAITFLFL